ncbi:thiamine pyrophosphate-requiring protein [Pseudorhodoplanes sp.]|uniref:thiamine pyrophosphate-requiring protein n=1 Tax=Pseudorhodoplanes sp. TaxID=1934341 RepID=UPI00391CA301
MSGPSGARQSKHAPIAAEIFLKTLAEHGVDYFFCNPGTDFPPIVEAFTRARHSNARLPRPVLVPHENLAVAMAHGAYLMTGRPQAVMVHVNVGTANTINNVTNLARDRAPLILAAGRTPFTEKGSFGSRSRSIHWAQEMFDQAGMLRELVKWDYEMKVPEQAADVAARAYEMTMTSPRGPVYLVLPREPLAAPVSETLASTPRQVPSVGCPDPQAIATLADWIAKAQSPLIVTSSDGDPRAVAALSKLADTYALPVVNHNPRVVTLPSSHAMHAGYDSGPLVPEADLIVNAECDVPYYPHSDKVMSGCKFAHIGEDPVYQRYPMRSFPSDLSLVARSADAFEALHAALEQHRPAMAAAIDARRKKMAERRRERTDKAEQAVRGASDKITPAYLSRCIGEAFGTDAVIFNEYPLSLEYCPREKPETFYSLGPAGGLGWGLGAAIGAKLAAPDKLIVATLGDGSYMFGNPTVSHWVQDKFNLPVLSIVFNNSRYGAVRRATLSMFKDGVAGETDGRFLADLDPSPPFDAFVTAQGGHGERVERPEDVPAALKRAQDAVRGGRQALLNVITPY